MAKQIISGTINDIYGRSGEWMFIDLGFGEKSRSCGVLKAVGQSKCVTFRDTVKFGEMVSLVKCVALRTTPFPLNLVLEAPLSVTFDEDGNPTGRACDTKGDVDRFWFLNQAALRMIVAAGYMMQEIAEHRKSMKRDIVLYEGFVSFKNPRSAHIKDAEVLKDAVWKPNPRELFAPEKLRRDPSHKLQSAFKVMGMDFGIPPVIRPDHDL